MDSHETYAALLDAFIDGELSEREAEEVRAHLASCAECQAYVSDAFAMREAFPDIEETVVPDGFEERVMSALPPRQISWRAQWKKVVLPLAACAAVVLLIRGLWENRLFDATGGSASDMEEAIAEITSGADAGSGMPETAMSVTDAGSDTPETVMSVMDAGSGTSGAVMEDMDAEAETSDMDAGENPPILSAAYAPETPEAVEDYGITSVSRSSESGAAGKRRDASPEETEPDGVPASNQNAATTYPDEYAATESLPDGDAATYDDALMKSVPVPEPAPKDVPEYQTAQEDAEDETADLSAASVSVWVIPTEAASLLDAHAPALETESGVWYALTPEEFDELSRNLSGMGMEARPGELDPENAPPITFPGVEYVFARR